jgi:N-methylhydantoinase A
VAAVGVCFLHAYANPAHERRMRELLAEEHPEAAVSLSSEVLREYREYERAMTTLVDAAVKPRVGRYVATIARRLGATTSAPAGPSFYVMKSNGGVLSAAEVVRQPISTVLSGPAAGALGAALVTTAAGFERVLTLDGGGTSTDVSVVLEGEPTLTTEGSVGAYPSKIPMIDVVTVGAGGGSVAWLSREGGLKVGPRSAGADPGPMCYGRGGTEPTVTDANLVLGRIPPHLLGGEVPLDPAAAAAGLEALGSKLGLDLPAVAAGVLEIAAWNQANALRRVTVQARPGRARLRPGHLRRVGVAGRLPAAGAARPARGPRPPRPRQPVGVRAADRRRQERRGARPRSPATPTSTRPPSPPPWPPSRPGRPVPGRRGVPRPAHRYLRSADLRYFGQAFEVRVPVPDGPSTRPHRGHRRRLPRRPPAPLRLQLPRRPHPAGRVGQPPRHRHRPHPPPHPPPLREGAPPGVHALRPGDSPPGPPASTRSMDLSIRDLSP